MPVSTLPPYAPLELVGERLPLIFPEGTPHRNYCVRELAAKTVFAMLYVGAVEGTGCHAAPKHVYRMTEEQASDRTTAARRAYAEEVLKPGFKPLGHRWYADNTREPIRDETLREGLVAIGAVLTRTDLPTTSSKPRYALETGFADLLRPTLKGKALDSAIRAWQEVHLSKGAMTRIALRRRGATRAAHGVVVTFPSGETRRLAPGPSSVIAQAVIEQFAPRFLREPAVLWLSESGNKVVARDDALAAEIGLRIEADRNLPDIILVDVGAREPLLVFFEVVATDGPVSERRRAALLELVEAAGFGRDQVAFVTAFADREVPAFKKTVAALAWGTFAWFASEPDNLLMLREGPVFFERLEASPRVDGSGGRAG